MRRARAGRRLFFLLLSALLIAALTGVLGVRTGEATGRGGGYELAVIYPSITRGGLASAVSIEVRRPGGFGGVVVVAMTSSYLDIFDENGLDPDPAVATTDAERVIWTFDPPEELDTMMVSFDARIEPGVQWRRVRGAVQILEDGRPVATARFRTLVLP